jgi:cell division protein FtsB
MSKNPFDEINYEYIYKNWCDPMKICHLISYDFEILEKDRSEVCTTPEFKLTNQIDGTWMMKYKPFGTNAPPSSESSPSQFSQSLASSHSLISNSPLGGMLKGMMKHLPKSNASLSFFAKGNKTINAKWQWILKTRNPTAQTPRTAEQSQKFEASGSYGFGGHMSLQTFFENGKAIIQIKGILTWDSELCKNPCYGISTYHVQPHQSSAVRGGRTSSSSKTSSLRSPQQPATVIVNETPLYLKISELEKRITHLQNDFDQCNNENSVLKKKIENLEKENAKLSQNEMLGGFKGDSDSYNESVIAHLKNENAKLQQKNYVLENEIQKLNVNQASMYGNQNNEEFVILKAENREYKVSKSALLNNSEILQGKEADTLTLNCNAATLQIFVTFCNNGTFNLEHLNNDDGICKFLDFVDEYKVNGLKAMIEDNLIQNLNHENIHEFATYAENYEMEDLFHESLVFAKDSLKSSNPISKDGLSKEFKTRLMEMMF